MKKLQVVSSTELTFDVKENIFCNNEILFTGNATRNTDSGSTYFQIVKGKLNGFHIEYRNSGGIKTILGYHNSIRNGYSIEIFQYGSLFAVFDMETIIEIIKVDKYGNTLETYNVENDSYEFENWKTTRKKLMDNKKLNPSFDIIPFYNLQNEYKSKVIQCKLTQAIKYVAGVDVAYNEIEQRMIGVIAILDFKTQELVEYVWHEMEVTFPYIPGLFSFREIPPLLEAFKKLKRTPDLIVCDGHGLAHPRGVGLATHFGIDLGIPTIGCAKNRLIGCFNKTSLGKTRGSQVNIVWESKIVGVALRTQSDIKPVFVSSGHLIDLETSIDLVLKLSKDFRISEPIRFADQLVKKHMKGRMKIDIYGDSSS